MGKYFEKQGIGTYLRRQAILNCMKLFEEKSLECFIIRDRERNALILSRYAAGMAQEHLAELVGVSHPAIWAMTEKYLWHNYPKLEALIEEKVINGLANDRTSEHQEDIRP